MKKCKCSHLDIIRGKKSVAVIKCLDCGRTWVFNNLMQHWSDSFIGAFKKEVNKEQ